MPAPGAGVDASGEVTTELLDATGPEELEAGALDGGTDDALPPGVHPATATITATPNATPTRRTRDRDPNQPIMDILASIFHDGPVWGWSAPVASGLF